MKEIKKITSFTVDHTKITPNIYVSRVDGDVTTYDMRTRRPNMGDYMDNLTMHSLEHMFATYVRSSVLADDVIYFGPMGCQTGFYLLVRNADNGNVLSVVKDVLRSIIAHDGAMFGEEGSGFMRMNLGCPRSVLEKALNQIKAAYDKIA